MSPGLNPDNPNDIISGDKDTLYNWHGAETDPPDAPTAIWFRFSDDALD